MEGLVSTSVVLRVHKNSNEENHSHTTKKDSQIAECTVVLKGGAVFHASERSEDMYASIDLVSHTLAQILKRHKDKVQSKRKNEKVRARIRVLKADRLFANHILLPNNFGILTSPLQNVFLCDSSVAI